MKEWREVLQIISGKSQKDVVNPNGQYPIYGSGGIIGYADDYLCEAGTTIIGRKGTINKPLFVTDRFWNVDTAFGVSPGKMLVPKYLFHFCEFFDFQALDKSTTIPSLAKSDLLKIEMPVPSIPEQQRIVSRIEELLSQLDSSVETLNMVEQQLTVYRQAVLKEAFQDIKDKSPIRNVSTLVTSGSRGWAKYYSDKGERFIRITDLTRNGIQLKEDNIQYVALPGDVEGKRTRLHDYDVLVSITADLGSIALIPKGFSEAYINQHIAMIRFKNPKQGRLMAWYLRSEYGQKELLKNKRGGGKLGLGLDDIRNTNVPVVSDEVAGKIVSNIASRLSICNHVGDAIQTALQQSAAMRQSILKQAFDVE